MGYTIAIATAIAIALAFFFPLHVDWFPPHSHDPLPLGIACKFNLSARPSPTQGTNLQGRVLGFSNARIFLVALDAKNWIRPLTIPESLQQVWVDCNSKSSVSKFSFLLFFYVVKSDVGLSYVPTALMSLGTLFSLNLRVTSSARNWRSELCLQCGYYLVGVEEMLASFPFFWKVWIEVDILAWCCSLGVVSYAMQEDDDDDLRKLGTCKFLVSIIRTLKL